MDNIKQPQMKEEPQKKEEFCYTPLEFLKDLAAGMLVGVLVWATIYTIIRPEITQGQSYPKFDYHTNLHYNNGPSRSVGIDYGNSYADDNESTGWVRVGSITNVRDNQGSGLGYFRIFAVPEIRLGFAESQQAELVFRVRCYEGNGTDPCPDGTGIDDGWVNFPSRGGKDFEHSIGNPSIDWSHDLPPNTAPRSCEWYWKNEYTIGMTSYTNRNNIAFGQTYQSTGSGTQNGHWTLTCQSNFTWRDIEWQDLWNKNRPDSFYFLRLGISALSNEQTWEEHEGSNYWVRIPATNHEIDEDKIYRMYIKDETQNGTSIRHDTINEPEATPDQVTFMAVEVTNENHIEYGRERPAYTWHAYVTGRQEAPVPDPPQFETSTENITQPRVAGVENFGKLSATTTPVVVSFSYENDTEDPYTYGGIIVNNYFQPGTNQTIAPKRIGLQSGTLSWDLTLNQGRYEIRSYLYNSNTKTFLESEPFYFDYGQTQIPSVSQTLIPIGDIRPEYTATTTPVVFAGRFLDCSQFEGNIFVASSFGNICSLIRFLIVPSERQLGDLWKLYSNFLDRWPIVYLRDFHETVKPIFEEDYQTPNISIPFMEEEIDLITAENLEQWTFFEDARSYVSAFLWMGLFFLLILKVSRIFYRKVKSV